MSTSLTLPLCHFTEITSGLVLAEVSCLEVKAFLTTPQFQRGFTQQELDYAAGLARGIQSLAARYAAKRAAQKLTDFGWETFEVVRTSEGVPSWAPHPDLALGGKWLMLSLSHDGDVALAYVGWGGSLIDL